ncbi:hypothetical protein Q5O89_08530 [Peribacillus frigoritolerans]|nr:hypothetical protein [Peribacillus frigoritolerans]
MEQVSLAGGRTLRQVMLEKQTIKEAYQKFTVKDSKVEGVSGESISKDTVKHVENLLKKSTCNSVELKTYLMKIDEYKGTNYADEFESFGKWPEDIQIPKESSILNADGSINWSEVPQGGYVLDKNGNAIKEEFIPKLGELLIGTGHQMVDIPHQLWMENRMNMYRGPCLMLRMRRNIISTK